MVRCFLQDTHTHTRDRNRKDRRMCDFRPTGTFTCARTARSAPSAARRSATESKMSSWVVLLACFICCAHTGYLPEPDIDAREEAFRTVRLSVRPFVRSFRPVRDLRQCLRVKPTRSLIEHRVEDRGRWNICRLQLLLFRLRKGNEFQRAFSNPANGWLCAASGGL